MTKYYIKRGKTYFARNIGGMQNHWVVDKKDAKNYTTMTQARQIIRQYQLKKCEIEKDENK